MALQSALTHSLLLRDQLQAELSEVKATPSPTALITSTPDSVILKRNEGQMYLEQGRESAIHNREGEGEAALRRSREREREKDMDEREREVSRRENWVVDEMRLASSPSSEVTLELRAKVES